MARTKEQTSFIMSRIRGKDSSIELALRKELWRRGLRYRKNAPKVCGRPDILFAKQRVAVFCDSEFWHGFDWKNQKRRLKSNKDFWIAKIERNMKRDKAVNARLKKEGWTVLRFWGKDITKDVASCADIVEKALEEAGARQTKGSAPKNARTKLSRKKRKTERRSTAPTGKTGVSKSRRGGRERLSGKPRKRV